MANFDLKRPWIEVFLGFGANLGDARATLRLASGQVAALPFMQLISMSSFYKTAPIDSDGPDYVNAVGHFRTQMSAPVLLSALQRIELAGGRERPYRNAPRTLDIDLLLYGSATVDSPALSVPHPRMWQRAFVLLPLAELAPSLVSPVQLAAVAGQGAVRMDDAF